MSRSFQLRRVRIALALLPLLLPIMMSAPADASGLVIYSVPVKTMDVVMSNCEHRFAGNTTLIGHCKGAQRAKANQIQALKMRKKCLDLKSQVSANWWDLYCSPWANTKGARNAGSQLLYHLSSFRTRDLAQSHTVITAGGFGLARGTYVDVIYSRSKTHWYRTHLYLMDGSGAMGGALCAAFGTTTVVGGGLCGGSVVSSLNRVKDIIRSADNQHKCLEVRANYGFNPLVMLKSAFSYPRVVTCRY